MKPHPPLSIIIHSRGNHFSEGGIYYFSMKFHSMCGYACTLFKNKTILYYTTQQLLPLGILIFLQGNSIISVLRSK